jgi:hypothetical protein
VTKAFDQEKSNFYGQGSVTQPYHSPAQIAAAAQGTLHNTFHMGNQHNHNFHSNGTNGIYHGNHNNNFHGHAQHQQNFGRNYQQPQSNNFVQNRQAINGNRHGHNGHHSHYQTQGQQGGYQFIQHGGGRTTGQNTMNHRGQYNAPFAQGGGMSASMNATNGYQRPFAHTPPTPTEPQGPTNTLSLNYNIPRAGVIAQSPLDTLGSSSLDLPDLSGSANGNDGGYRHTPDVHTSMPKGAPFNPSAQSYFPQQQNQTHHNGYPPNQGYTGGHVGSRF